MKRQKTLSKLLWLASLTFILACESDFESSPLIVESQILELVNQHRQSIGKQSLELDTYMSYECRTHSKNMAEGSVSFGHDGFGDRVDRIKKEIGGGGSGENVAVGYQSAESVMEGWLNSSGHRANIEGNFTTIGIGAYQEEGGGIYYTQIFLNK